MDPESVGKETIIKVTDWLRGIWEMRRRNGPVQQWVDSIPSPAKVNTPRLSVQRQEDSPQDPIISSGTPIEPKNIPLCNRNTKSPNMTISEPVNVPGSPATNTPGTPNSLPYRLARDPSLQSDSSHCSSVESLLELRKADPEAILLGLGFGGCSTSPQESGPLSRIPKRFLQPSKLKGIAIDDFVKHQQETSESFDSISLGYRGLTGSPYVTPSEIVQKIMDRLREHESHEMDVSVSCNSYEPYGTHQQSGKLSVLSPDNRQFLEQPRSRSPDMRNKRMIIGQKSFAFGHDGDLIELDSSDNRLSKEDAIINNNKDDDDDDSNDDNDANANANANAIYTNGKNNMNFDNINYKDIIPGSNCTLDNVLTKKVEKIFPKQLSFDHTEYYTTDQDPAMDAYNENSDITPSSRKSSDMLPIDLANSTAAKREDATSITRKDCHCPNCSHNRRSGTAGSCNAKLAENQPVSEVQTRHSIGRIRGGEHESDECMPLRRRKSLKRQSRVSDKDATRYCATDQADDNEPALNGGRGCAANLLRREHLYTSSESFMVDVHSAHRVEHKNAYVKGAPSMSAADNSVYTMETDGSRCENYRESKSRVDVNETCCTDENQRCCYNDKLGRVCLHEKDYEDCCCRVDSTKCWKRVEKILRKNKKLEDMVARNRREMAEIRDMLSSVLSVRMEPGF